MFDECEIIEAIEGAASLILSAHKPSAFTGAGISQESGIPTYRRMNGSIWETVNVDDVGTAFAFYQNPQRVWDFWSEQRAIMLNAEPNHGHNSLSKIEADYTSGLPIITQNVDNLHERAGSRNVIHLHGDITKLRCSKYCKGVPSIIPFIDLDVEETSIPDCPYCGELARYDVIMFGEYLHAYPMEQANIIIEQTDLMIVIGTSGVVAPASKIPLRAQDNGAKLIEINPTISRITPNVDVFIPLNSEQALPRILEAIKKTI